MTKDRLLTDRWNNLLALGLGLPLLLYVVFVSSSSVLSARASFLGLVLLGVLY